MNFYNYLYQKRNLLYVFMILSLLMAGCDKDLLTTVPTDRLSENIFWKSQADAELAVNALYNDLDGAEIFYLDALTDIAHVNQPFAVDAYIEQGTYDASSSRLYNAWSNAYKGIGAVNYFLANVNKIEGSKNEALITRYISEARVLRAYQYIKLAYLFGKVPLVTTPLTLQEGRKVQQAELAEIYDFIDKELEQAAAGLPHVYSGNDIGRITRWAALGLKARANLYAGRFAAAVKGAKLIIDSHQFELYPNYATLFSYAAENNKEVLLDKQYLENIYTQNVFNQLAPYSQQNGQSTYVPTKALVDSYLTSNGQVITDAADYDVKNPYKNRDPRLYHSIFLDGDQLPSGAIFHPAPNSGTADAVGSTYIASTTGFNIKKYIDKKDLSNPSKSGLNIMLLRYAEILLTFAEAKIEIGEIDESVYAAINQVRNSRNDVKLPNINAIGDSGQLRQLVRRERTVELAFEGLHLADIRRWKTAEKVVPGKVYGITYQNNKGETVVVEVASQGRVFDPQKHYLWPIPQREINLNSNLRQNPNW